MKNKISIVLYSALYLIFNLPTKALASMQVKYGPMQELYGVSPVEGPVEWFTVAWRYLLLVFVPLGVIFLVILGIRSILKKKRKK